ncbi:cytochrome oxidase putative small subunit CydP [Sapientia aquatica]|uniref:Uncharacterized protein n=1 Tax=Sapientia aquatica TaxID=1549640 RepID=A0A4R5W4C1_9BURK|nr:hypothetical protein E2I14_08115 [Sapientia aquatica]
MKHAIRKVMTHKPRSLFLHLAIAVLIKLIVLVGLWWFFIRDSSVVVNADFMATHIGVPANSQGVSK